MSILSLLITMVEKKDGLLVHLTLLFERRALIVFRSLIMSMVIKVMVRQMVAILIICK